jgi:hypothetical protein
MATQHGRKRYLQILLDPARHELAKQVAEEKNMRTTEWIRQTIYAALERELPASVYRGAEASDQALWRQSVLNRVEGRAKARAERIITDVQQESA